MNLKSITKIVFENNDNFRNSIKELAEIRSVFLKKIILENSQFKYEKKTSKRTKEIYKKRESTDSP